MNEGDSWRRVTEADVRAALARLTRPHEVKLDRDDTLTFRRAPGYELDARQCSSARGLLDTLWHLREKRWFTRNVFIDFIATMKGRAERMAAAWRKKNERGQRKPR